MGAPRVWPTIAADDRDTAAEFVNNGAGQLARVRNQVPREYRGDILEIELNLANALRLLEKHGAKTRIPDPLRP
jgi:hypothetical protein